MIKITIEETKIVAAETREWKQVANTGNTRDGGAAYDYVKDQWHQEKTVTLLEQEMEEIDLVAVIKAVNKIN